MVYFPQKELLNYNVLIQMYMSNLRIYVNHIQTQKNNYMTKSVMANKVFYIKANFNVITFNI